MVNGKAVRLFERGSLALTVVNSCLVLAVCWQLHQLGLHWSVDPTTLQCPADIHALLSLPSLHVVLLTVLLLAVLIGKEWLRPRWMSLVVNLLWLVAGSLLLQHLTVHLG